MKPDAADNSVPRSISALLSKERLILRETQRAVTPLGGVAVFVAFLHKLGLVEKLRQHMPIQLKSPNHIDPTATFTAFLIAVLAGARRFAHANWLRGDRALHALLGLSRFPIDDTIRNLFRRFGMGDVHRLFDPLAEWQMERFAGTQRGLQLGFGFHRLGTLWPAARLVERTQSAQTRTPQSSSLAGRARRSSLPAPRLAPQRQLRSSAWRGGVSPRSPRAVGTAPDDPPGSS